MRPVFLGAGADRQERRRASGKMALNFKPRDFGYLDPTWGIVCAIYCHELDAG